MLCDSSGESKNLLNVYLICLILDFLFLNKITNKQISTDFLEHFYAGFPIGKFFSKNLKKSKNFKNLPYVT